MVTPLLAFSPVGSGLPSVSIVLPVRNEATRIENILKQIFAQDYPRSITEVIVVDGGSNDSTPDIAAKFCQDGHSPVVLRLKERGRSQGLNRGIKMSRNQLILRLDARTIIEPDYLSLCVAALMRTGADNVGGVQKAIGKTRRQQAFAIALSIPFGVGDAQFRLGKRSGFVDSAYLGCFKREVFDRIGYFDEESAIISEDSDINFRIRKAGGKVYLDTQIVAQYEPRESFFEFFRLYYRYGGAKAGILLKHKRLISWRQTIPPTLLLCIIIFSLTSLIAPEWALPPLLGLASVYLLSNLLVSIFNAAYQRKAYLFPLLFFTFCTMHFGYGMGYLKRLLVPETPGTYWKY